MDGNKSKREKRIRRKIRVRAKAMGTAVKPRLSVFRSNRHIFLQLIDDEKGKTILSVADARAKAAKKTGAKAKTKKTEAAFSAGQALAGLALKKKIKNVVFDRGGRPYHGRVKAAAEGAREGGLIF